MRSTRCWSLMTPAPTTCPCQRRDFSPTTRSGDFIWGYPDTQKQGNIEFPKICQNLIYCIDFMYFFLLISSCPSGFRSRWDKWRCWCRRTWSRWEAFGIWRLWDSTRVNMEAICFGLTLASCSLNGPRVSFKVGSSTVYLGLAVLKELSKLQWTGPKNVHDYQRTYVVAGFNRFVCHDPSWLPQYFPEGVRPPSHYSVLYITVIYLHI